MTYQKLFVVVLGLFYSGSMMAQTTLDVIQKKPLSIGELVEIRSEVLDENRLLNIYLPATYGQDSSATYPLIYLLDGSIDEDFIHIAGIVQFGSFSWINMLPESIVVGIANVDRKRDFTYPSNNSIDLKELPSSGGSEKFIEFIEKELQPFLHKQYKTTTKQTLIGQSLGGLLASEILFKKPALFDQYIIVSPSLWWDDESLLKQAPKPIGKEKSVYVAVGKEGEVMERLARDLFDKLQRSYSGKPNLSFDYFEQLDHGDTLHLAVYQAFEKLFRKKEKADASN